MIETTTFTWLSDVGDDDDVQLGGNGAQVLRIEKVHDEAGECELGDLIGLVAIVETTFGHGRRSRGGWAWAVGPGSTRAGEARPTSMFATRSAGSSPSTRDGERAHST